MRRHRGRHGGRPPWWPEGETWPPSDRLDTRGRFLRRVGCLVGGAFALFFVGSSLIGWLFFGGDDHDRGGWSGPPFGFFGVLLLIIVVVAVTRAVRRTAGPIGDVMAAADRVAGGDYAARVATRAPGEVGRLVDSFNEMAERLQVNEEQRRNLLADVAHELRTPLAVIRGNVEGMLDGLYARDDERLGSLLDETAMMARLLDDLRTLAMAEAKALRLHREGVDAADLVDDVVAVFAPRAEAAGVELSRNVGAVEELNVDPVRVRQVLDNLLANALRHTPRGGSVRVTVEQRGPIVAFSIADTGSGIAPEALPHVFDRFWKSADSGGSGLGLAIAKSLVEAHGGEIAAESALGSGTTIRFMLPRDETPPERATVPAPHFRDPRATPA